MRGSPIFRTLLVLVLLALAGFALASLTGRSDDRVAQLPAPIQEAASPASGKLKARYTLTLSASPSRIEVDAGGETSTAAEGAIEFDPANPVVGLKISWAASPAPATDASVQRFARLVLDVTGRDSLTHVFVASGDIDDVWEPELQKP